MNNTEDPDASNEFFEDLDPLTTDSPVAVSTPTHEQKVQRWLGTSIVISALLGYLVVIAFYLLDMTEPSASMESLSTYAISGLQTLAAAVVGFYFGSKNN